MAKLYGKELDDELAKRKKVRENRLNNRITLRIAAKNNDMGLTSSEYCGWENGEDVCPHEKYEPMIGGIHPPFLVFDRCVKCGHIQSACRAEDDMERTQEAFELLNKNDTKKN